jgi:hypothetical protein
VTRPISTLDSKFSPLHKGVGATGLRGMSGRCGNPETVITPISPCLEMSRGMTLPVVVVCEFLDRLPVGMTESNGWIA